MPNTTSKEERVIRYEAAAETLVGLGRGSLEANVRNHRNQFDAPVLALAYHRLWIAGRTEEAEAVAWRLFSGGPGRGSGPDYLGWLFRAAMTRVSDDALWRIAEDLYQGTLVQIVEVLRTGRGARAHTAWRPFCFHRLSDAVRERTRENLPTEDLDAPHPETGRPKEYHELGYRQTWHGAVEPDRLEELMEHLRHAAERIEDPEVRLVALDQFFDDPSPIEFEDPSRPGRKPLTEVLGKTRFSIRRLVLKAKELLLPARREWEDGDARPDRVV